MITLKATGDFSKANKFCERLLEVFDSGILNKYGRRGVEALKMASPKESGLMADSWDYEIIRTDNKIKIVWTNSDIEGGYNVAILVQYGHRTRGGTYVEGIDYINPAMRPIFNELANEIAREVRG